MREIFINTTILQTIVFCALVGVNSITTAEIFHDDFSGGLSKWAVIGSPPPNTTNSQGNPNPSFATNDDGSSGGFGLSKTAFSYIDNDFTISVDVKHGGDSPDDRKKSGVGLSTSTTPTPGSPQATTTNFFFMELYGTGSDPRSDSLQYSLTLADSTVETGSFAVDGDGWHNIAMSVRSETGNVDFFHDGMHLGSSSGSITTLHNGNAGIFLGNRRSFYDNVRVSVDEDAIKSLDLLSYWFYDADGTTLSSGSGSDNIIVIPNSAITFRATFRVGNDNESPLSNSYISLGVEDGLELISKEAVVQTNVNGEITISSSVQPSVLGTETGSRYVFVSGNTRFDFVIAFHGNPVADYEKPHLVAFSMDDVIREEDLEILRQKALTNSTAQFTLPELANDGQLSEEFYSSLNTKLQEELEYEIENGWQPYPRPRTGEMAVGFQATQQHINVAATTGAYLLQGASCTIGLVAGGLIAIKTIGFGAPVSYKLVTVACFPLVSNIVNTGVKNFADHLNERGKISTTTRNAIVTTSNSANIILTSVHPVPGDGYFAFTELITDIKFEGDPGISSETMVFQSIHETTTVTGTTNLKITYASQSGAKAELILSQLNDDNESDSDGDGIPDASDAFPLDPSESVDTDGDGIGNNADPDDDGDGLSDVDEVQWQTDPLVSDTDLDGLSDGAEVSQGRNPTANEPAVLGVINLLLSEP